MGTSIEWTNRPGTIGEVQNFVTGCTRVSEGCRLCYIERQTPMRVAHRKFDGPNIGATLPLQLHWDRIDRPLRWRKPRTVFVNSMSDWMHKDIPRSMLLDALAVWAVTPQHTYLALTKRHDRLRAFLSDPATEDAVRDRVGARWCSTLDDVEWPLPNLWVGVSAEDQKWADTRGDALRNTPAAVRFLSLEPLLGPIDRLNLADISWVIVGGESGRGALQMRAEWARVIADQCADAGVAFFFKQAGAVLAKQWGCTGVGHDPAQWPEPFPRQWPTQGGD